MSHDGGEVQVSFCPVPTPDVQADVLSVGATKTEMKAGETVTTSRGEQGERPKFGPRPKFNSKDFDFKQELVRLPFPVNIGEVELSQSQQKHFLELVYDHQSIFSLCNEDLGLCDHLKHTILTMTMKPVYLPHHMIPVQLQTEVHKCLDTWLRQGIIRPSCSPYASQVVIVRKKSGELCLCIGFRALNAVTIRDSFPLRQIEEALQAVRSAMWLTSFDLAQGYLQLAMDEADIHKTAFRADSSGLYEFTHMSFGLSNVGASFCHLMEMCPGDQQYLTLLFYLDDICVFSSSIDEMLNRVEMVLKRLQDNSHMCVISYVSRALKPYEKSMRNYSSAKLELLPLKWSVCKKFRDYLIGSKFTVLTDNNPLTYVCTS